MLAIDVRAKLLVLPRGRLVEFMHVGLVEVPCP